MNRFFILPCIISLFSCGNSSNNNSNNQSLPQEVCFTSEQLMDKIKGGWAGQTIGVTYGGPTEFKYNGTIMQDYIPIEWNDDYVSWWYDNIPGLYDDIYMDLTFVEVFDKLGLDAPVDSFAIAFAKAEYPLWHANLAARYNILNGIMPPESGHWLNNPHADDLDYQIEADFSGLMSPGMPNSASEISDKIGHIMCYGNGWYGGVYVGAMYSLAFVSSDINYIVEEALKTIPSESSFYQCMKDVINWHKEYPTDWKQTWFECEKKWSPEIGCPDGVYAPFNIDATINCAYVLIGLLYGEGDFYKTMDIATRCGQDSDCNPATAAGILGTVIGYNKIPDVWVNPLKKVEDRNFVYTNISLNNVYEMSYKHALWQIEKNGGKVNDGSIKIKVQEPKTVRYEKSFDGHYPSQKMTINKNIDDINQVSFNGKGIVFKGYISSKLNEEYIAEVSMFIDGQFVEKAKLPLSNTIVRRTDLFWKYQLTEGKHEVTFKWHNPNENISIYFGDAIIYSDEK